MKEERIQRIQAMERALNETTDAVTQMEIGLKKLEGALPQLEQLIRYYQSELWMQDYDADHAGQLPPELCRGVLAQDTVYDLLQECGRLQHRMEHLAELLRDTV